MVSPNFEIIVGTYEEFLVGHNFIAEQSEITPSFAAHDHSSSIRCLCISGQYLATGAADDRIIVYDLKTRKEHCMLTHHDSTVSCLQFTSNHSHLLSGSSDGVLAIARVGNWQVEKVWDNAHKGSAILDIAVHTSGKLALTLGADHTLRTWNLVKGRQAYAINLNSKSTDAKSLEKIIWSEDGIRFILFGGKYTEIWCIETGGALKVIEHDEKVCSCIWFAENKILVGYENGQMALFEINNLTKIVQQAHDSRVKVLALHNDWVVSGSSSGEIKVWDRELQEVAKQDLGCRITCLGIVPHITIKKEAIAEDGQEQTATSTVLQKSSVIIEIEGDDDASIKYDSPDVKSKSKKEVGKGKGHGSSAVKGKMKKRKSRKGVNETEKEKIKKEKKQKRKRKNDGSGGAAKQTPEVVKIMGPYMGCGRKRKEIIDANVNAQEPAPTKRRRKSEEPIKTEMTEDGQPKLIGLGEIMGHLEERRRIKKEKREIIAYFKEKNQKLENIKTMAPYMGCGRKRKEIIDTSVNGREVSKKVRRRKLEKPVKKDTSVNEPSYTTIEELRLQIISDSIRMEKERKEKRRAKKNMSSARRSKE